MFVCSKLNTFAVIAISAILCLSVVHVQAGNTPQLNSHIYFDPISLKPLDDLALVLSDASPHVCG